MAGITLSELLKKMIEMGGSDLHITTNSPPRVRVHGKLRPMDLAPLTAAERPTMEVPAPLMEAPLVLVEATRKPAWNSVRPESISAGLAASAALSSV